MNRNGMAERLARDLMPPATRTRADMVVVATRIEVG